jgi:hypothetical protein
MKVRIMYGPKEGQILHAPFSENTQAQINSGLWEAVVEAPKPSETRWFLGKEELSEQHYLGFKCEFCRETSSYYPDVNLGAEKIVQVVRPHCTHRTPCPLEIANGYVVAGGGKTISFAAACAKENVSVFQPAPEKSDYVLALELGEGKRK